MRNKLLSLLAIFIAVFTFSSCEDVEELAGSVDITIDKETYHLPAAVFYSNGDNTFITGFMFKESLGISVSSYFALTTSEHMKFASPSKGAFWSEGR